MQSTITIEDVKDNSKAQTLRAKLADAHEKVALLKGDLLSELWSDELQLCFYRSTSAIGHSAWSFKAGATISSEDKSALDGKMFDEMSLYCYIPPKGQQPAVCTLSCSSIKPLLKYAKKHNKKWTLSLEAQKEIDCLADVLTAVELLREGVEI